MALFFSSGEETISMFLNILMIIPGALILSFIIIICIYAAIVDFIMFVEKYGIIDFLVNICISLILFGIAFSFIIGVVRIMSK